MTLHLRPVGLSFGDFEPEHYPLHQSGSASTLPTEQERDIIERLHEVVAEITGKPVDRPKKPRMGFL